MNKIAIIVTVYNRSSGLRQCLSSVFDQQQAADEVLVIDDGSYEEHASHIRSITTDFSEVQLVVCPNNEGVSAARNAAVERVASDWVIFLDDDDELLPNAVSDAQKAFRAHHKADVLIRRAKLTGRAFWVAHYEAQAQKSMNYPIEHREWFFQFTPALHAMVFRTECVKAVGFPPNLHYGEDRILCLKMRKKGARFAVMDQLVAVYNQNSNTNRQSWIQKLAYCRYVRTHGLMDHSIQRAHIRLFEAYGNWQLGKPLTAIGNLLLGLHSPRLFIRYLILWIRKV